MEVSKFSILQSNNKKIRKFTRILPKSILLSLAVRVDAALGFSGFLWDLLLRIVAPLTVFDDTLAVMLLLLNFVAGFRIELLIWPFGSIWGLLPVLRRVSENSNSKLPGSVLRAWKTLLLSSCIIRACKSWKQLTVRSHHRTRKNLLSDIDRDLIVIPAWNKWFLRNWNALHFRISKIHHAA